MKTYILFVFFIIIQFSLFAQSEIDKQNTSIVEEGKKLYRTEIASWYGTDIVLEQFSHKRNIIEGYFSYIDKDETKCVFISSKSKKIVLTLTFDLNFDKMKVKIDSLERSLTKNESDLYTIRTTALSEIKTDTMFKRYKNTSLNIIPFIENGIKRVFLITGTSQQGIVYFGNDYVLNFDRKNKLISKKRIHQTLIPVKYYHEDSVNASDTKGGSWHTHSNSTGDLITSTDVCTLMLYQNLANWRQHIIMSQKYVSLWDCPQNKIITLTKEAWDRIYDNKK